MSCFPLPTYALGPIYRFTVGGREGGVGGAPPSPAPGVRAGAPVGGRSFLSLRGPRQGELVSSGSGRPGAGCRLPGRGPSRPGLGAILLVCAGGSGPASGRAAKPLVVRAGAQLPRAHASHHEACLPALHQQGAALQPGVLEMGQAPGSPARPSSGDSPRDSD